MKKNIILLLAFIIASKLHSQREIDIKARIINPKQNGTITSPGIFTYTVRIINKGYDRITTADSLYMTTDRYKNDKPIYEYYKLKFPKDIAMGDSADFVINLSLNDSISTNYYIFRIFTGVYNKKTNDILRETQQQQLDNGFTGTFNLIYNPNTSVNSFFNSNKLVIYPNPSIGILNIQLPNIAKNTNETIGYNIFNMQGALVYHTKLANNFVQTINLQTLAAGDYVLTAQTNGNVYRQIFTLNY